MKCSWLLGIFRSASSRRVLFIPNNPQTLGILERFLFWGVGVHSYCWWTKILHQLRLVIYHHYLQGFVISQVVLASSNSVYFGSLGDWWIDGLMWFPWMISWRAVYQYRYGLEGIFVHSTRTIPIPSMYGIFTYIWLMFMVNVGKNISKYTIHGWYGILFTSLKPTFSPQTLRKLETISQEKIWAPRIWAKATRANIWASREIYVCSRSKKRKDWKNHSHHSPRIC